MTNSIERGVKYSPELLKEETEGLSETQELMVFRTFLYNGLYGKAIPFEQRERVFARLDDMVGNLKFLLKTKILSEDEDKSLFVTFLLGEM